MVIRLLWGWCYSDWDRFEENQRLQSQLTICGQLVLIVSTSIIVKSADVDVLKSVPVNLTIDDKNLSTSLDTICNYI